MGNNGCSFIVVREWQPWSLGEGKRNKPMREGIPNWWSDFECFNDVHEEEKSEGTGKHPAARLGFAFHNDEGDQE